MRKKITVFYGLLMILILTPLVSFAEKSLLRVGTTGDYQPMTWYDTKEKRFVGFDIDIMQSVADYLHVKLVFVRTTWTTLSKDLEAGKFDMAIGGISITPERKNQFIFSTPVVNDKKVVVIRCTDKTQLNSWETIDQPSVRLLENIGGTNEGFAKKYAQNAHLILINNNRMVFNQIIHHNADAMVTDSLEANYQVYENPLLCTVTLPTAMSPTVEKAYMLRKNETALQHKINQAIEQLQKDNTLNKIANAWGIS